MVRVNLDSSSRNLCPNINNFLSNFATNSTNQNMYFELNKNVDFFTVR